MLLSDIWYRIIFLEDYRVTFFLTWSFFARLAVISWSPLRSILFPTSITGTPLQKCLTSFAHCTSTFASESGLNKEWKLLYTADYKSPKENFCTAQITNHPKCEFDCNDIIWLSIASYYIDYKYCIFATFKFILLK